MFQILRTMSLACFSVFISFSALADDWTQWRGNHRDGKSSETGLLDQWPKEGPTLLWQTNDLGSGYSTPSSAGGMVYLICNQDLDNEEVVALSLADGTRKWSTRLGKVGKNNGPQYPASRSTPTIDGKQLYALGSAGDLACLDASSGEVLWTKNLPVDFGGKAGAWAYTESPLIDGDALICTPGGDSATVVSLNKSDASIIWKTPLPEADEASYSSPVIATIDGVKQYVFFLAKGTAGISAETGELLWRYTKTSDRAANIQTPVTQGNFVYTAASRVGGGLVKVSAGEAVPEEVYFAKTMPSGMGGSILNDGNLYGSAGEVMMCIDYASGETRWKSRTIGACSLCYADGKIYLHGDNNDVAVIAADPTAYRELGRFTPANAPARPGRAKAWTYPIIVDGKLIIRDVGTVWCYDISG